MEKDNSMVEYEVKVYTLSGSDDNVFYVGCTLRDVEKRLREHIVEARYYERHEKKAKRFKAIADNNYNVYATIIDIQKITSDNIHKAKIEAEKIELVWVHKFMAEGVKLTNSKTGRNRQVVNNPQFVGKIIKAA